MSQNNKIELEQLELLVSEIFYSIQGEGTNAGKPCVFIRLKGCNLRCCWCDTVYAQDAEENEEFTNAKIIYDQIRQYKCQFIEFTGGEPLLQRDVIAFMEFLCDEGYQVAIETNGTISISPIDKRVIKIVDIKCPSSGMSQFINFDCLLELGKNDDIKFVISNKEDFLWAKSIVKLYNLENVCNSILFSPVYNFLEPKILAKWILEEHLKVRLQLQLHKYIWGADIRGV